MQILGAHALRMIEVITTSEDRDIKVRIVPPKGKTAEGTALQLHNNLRARATRQPKKETVAWVSFTDPVSARRALALITAYSLEPFHQMYYTYAGIAGGGIAIVNREDTADFDKFLRDIYRDMVRLNEVWLESDTKHCQEFPDVTGVCDANVRAKMEENRQQLASLKEQGQILVQAIGVRARIGDLLRLWDEAPEVFTVKAAPAGVFGMGMPLFPETSMDSWF